MLELRLSCTKDRQGLPYLHYSLGNRLVFALISLIITIAMFLQAEISFIACILLGLSIFGLIYKESWQILSDGTAIQKQIGVVFAFHRQTIRLADIQAMELYDTVPSASKVHFLYPMRIKFCVITHDQKKITLEDHIRRKNDPLPKAAQDFADACNIELKRS